MTNPLAAHLQAQQEKIIAAWARSVDSDDNAVAVSRLCYREFRDHIPQVLRTFETNLCALSAPHQTPDPSAVEDAAQKHGAHRWQQGYKIGEMVREWEHLNLVVLDEIEAFAAQNEDSPCDWVASRRVWAQTVGEGITASAARFDELSRHEAKSRMHDLEETLEAIRSMERERGEILRQASHDMRGSLTVVQGAASLLDWNLLQSLPPQKRDDVITMLNNSVGALSQMMGDVLDLSRLEAGQEERNLGEFDAGAMLRDLGQSAISFAQDRGLELQIEGPIHFRVENDASKVRRITQNLLLNAIKYTEQGTVRLTWRSLQEGDADHWELIIADTGCGIPQRHMDGIVRELAQATQEGRAIGASIPSPDALRSTKEPEKPSPSQSSPIRSGEGIGLSIVKRLCEILDATLELETDSSGSTFRVVFPRSY